MEATKTISNDQLVLSSIGFIEIQLKHAAYDIESGATGCM